MNKYSLKRIIIVASLVFFNLIIIPDYVQAAISITSASPTQINTPEDIITLNVTASGLQSNTQYLEVGFTKSDETPNYFGLTKNSLEEWYQYKSSPTTNDLSTYFFSFVPVNGAWSGQVSAKLDLNDSGFKGAGNYDIRLSKYITSSASYSNVVTVSVNVTPTPTPTPSPTPTQTQTPTPSPTPQPTQVPTHTPTPTTRLVANTPTPTQKPTPTPTIAEKESATFGAVLGEVASPTPTVKVESASWKTPLTALLFIVLGLGLVGYSAFSFWQQYARKNEVQ